MVIQEEKQIKQTNYFCLRIGSLMSKMLSLLCKILDLSSKTLNLDLILFNTLLCFF